MHEKWIYSNNIARFYTIEVILVHSEHLKKLMEFSLAQKSQNPMRLDHIAAD